MFKLYLEKAEEPEIKLPTSVQFSSVAQLCPTLCNPWIAARQASLINSRSSPRLAFIESVMPSSHPIFGRPLLLLPTIPPSIRVFSNESTLHMRWPTSVGSSKKQEFQKNIYFCFIDYAKAFDCMGHNKLWKILQDMGMPDHLTCLLRNLYAGQETTVKTGHGQQIGSRSGKEYTKAVYCHLAYLT